MKTLQSVIPHAILMRLLKIFMVSIFFKKMRSVSYFMGWTTTSKIACTLISIMKSIEVD